MARRLVVRRAPGARRCPGARATVLLAILASAPLLVGCGGTDGGGGAGGERPRLVVSAAASLKTAFTAYGKEFRNADARFSFAGSNDLAAQIAAGARPDLFASANTTLPDALYVAGLVSRPLRFASNELVLATQAGNDEIRTLRDITKRGVKLAIGAPAVPVGSYTRTVIDRMPRRDGEAIRANVRTEEPDVIGIVGKLTQNAVDAGFVYHTDVVATRGKLKEIKLSGALTPVVEYGIAIVKGSKRELAAKAFVYGLLNGSGREALTREGFGFPPPK